MKHILVCPKVHRLIEKHLHLPMPERSSRADSLLLMSPRAHDINLVQIPNSDEAVRARGIAVYAAYRLHNGLRHLHHSVRSLDAAFCEYTHEGWRSSSGGVDV